MLAPAERKLLMDKIRVFPPQFEAVVRDLTDAQLDFTASPADWTARQVVHHVADSHMNAYMRMKLGLTENHPTIKPYDQEAFAELVDTKQFPIASSLAIIGGLHARWVALMESLSDEQWARAIFHPENGDMTMEDILKTYAAHGENHIEQIARQRQAQGL